MPISMSSGCALTNKILFIPATSSLAIPTFTPGDPSRTLFDQAILNYKSGIHFVKRTAETPGEKKPVPHKSGTGQGIVPDRVRTHT